MFSFNSSKIVWDHELGSGASGNVYVYREKNSQDEKYAVKQIVTPNTEVFLAAIQEIVLGFSCDHPNVLSVKGYSIDLNNRSWNVYLKMDRMETSLKARLAQYITNKQTFSEEDLVKYFYSLADGLKYLHDRRIAHRDIKPDNILIDKQGILKISDIGVGRHVDDENTEDVTQQMGTYLYTAPEVLASETAMKKQELFKTDIWSLGVVMAELCMTKTRLVKGNLSGAEKEAEYAKILKDLRKKYSKKLLELVEGLLKANPKERKSLSEVKRVLEATYPEILKANVRKSISRKYEEENGIEEVKESDTEVISIKELEDKIRNAFDIEEEHNEVKDLIKLTAKCKTSHLCETDIGHISTYVTSELPPLEHFSLDVSQCPDVNDYSVQSLAATIGTNLKTLQHLDLNFSGCLKLTDQALMDLSLQVGSNLKALRHIDLNLSSCPNITDKGLTDLAVQIKELEHLTLRFANCDKITDKGLKALAEHIGQYLPNLTHVELDFSGCEKIRDQGLKDIVNQSKPLLKSLQFFSVNLKETGVTNKLKEDTKKYLVRIPKLNIS